MHGSAQTPSDLKAKALSVDNASIAYSAKGPSVVNDVSFDVVQGEAFILVGRSGCGKSTLLRTLGGFQPLRSGTIKLNGRNIRGPGPDRMMVFQNFDQLLPWRTAISNIEFAIRNSGKGARSTATKRAIEALEMVHLAGAAEKYPHQLSGGMQQRIAIARALAVRPNMVLMDEPFGALDAMTRSALQRELLQLQTELEMTLVFVTHSISEAIYLGDRIGVMTPEGKFAEIFENRFKGQTESPQSAEFAQTLRDILGVPS